MNVMAIHVVDAARPRRKKWTRDEYYRLADGGFFRHRRVELINGEIIEMPAVRDLHVAAVELAGRVLRRVFDEGEFCTRIQAPLHLLGRSAPEPDLAVVRAGPRDFIGKGHPASALLVIEVSDTSLRYDQTRKAHLYAAAGLLDYWIINLIDGRLEVRRDPAPDPAKHLRYHYASTLIVREGDVISPLSMPSATIRAADLLP